MHIPFLAGRPPHDSLEIDEQLFLRGYRLRDYKAWRDLHFQSKSFLQPWQPLPADKDMTFSSYRKQIAGYKLLARAGIGYLWLIRARGILMVDGSRSHMKRGIVIGIINVLDIRRAGSQTATIGYSMGEAFAGKGYMKRVLPRVADYCFDTLDLKRLEAACQENNIASRRLLKSCGFVEEGIARELVEIDGKRRDHIIYSLLSHDPRSRK